MKSAGTAQSRSSSLELLGENLIYERARKKLTQVELSAASGVARQTISDIERGVANPTVDVLDKLVASLGIAIDRLFLDDAYKSRGDLTAREIERRRSEGKSGDKVDARAYLDALDEEAAERRKK